jgi:hypothetical protein
MDVNMKRNISILTFLLLVVAASYAQGTGPDVASTPATQPQAQTLTHDQIAAAIAQGTKSNGKAQGLELFDPGPKWIHQLQKHKDFLGSDSDDISGLTGYSIAAYTPFTWIAEQASKAAREHRSFTEQDVTAEMLRPVFRVRAFPSGNPDEENPGIAEVLIVDLSQEQYLQPDLHENFDSHGQKGLYAEFSIEYLPQLAQKDTEFFIRVTGNNGQQKQFKIKKKHFSKLP